MQAAPLGLTAGLVPVACFWASVAHWRQRQTGDGLRPENAGAGQGRRISAVSSFNCQLTCKTQSLTLRLWRRTITAQMIYVRALRSQRPLVILLALPKADICLVQ